MSRSSKPQAEGAVAKEKEELLLELVAEHEAREKAEKWLNEALDRLIDVWHELSDPHDGRELHEFLGMTWEQYGRWVEDPSSLTAPQPEEEKR